MGIQKVESEANYGIYVWQLDNGKVFGNQDGDVLNIPGQRFDIEKMRKITDAAKADGAPAGKAVFLPGVGRVSEMRASEEKGRMAEGYIPSETDIGAWEDAMRGYEAAMRDGRDYDAN